MHFIWRKVSISYKSLQFFTEYIKHQQPLYTHQEQFLIFLKPVVNLKPETQHSLIITTSNPEKPQQNNTKAHFKPWLPGYEVNEQASLELSRE